MTKKLLSVILLLTVAIACFFGFTACENVELGNTDGKHVHDYVNGFCQHCGEQKPSSGLTYTVNSDGRSCTVTGIGSCTDTDILIPSDIDGYSVSEIGSKAFASCKQITSLIIPNTVKTIGTRAFYGCMGLTEMHIPSSVTNIGTQIFYKASNLSTVYYDSSYADKDNPFLDLVHITKIVFNCNEIKQYMCNLTYNPKIVIGSEVTKICENVFSGYSALDGVYITDISAWCNMEFGDLLSNPLYYANKLYLNDILVTDLVIPNSVTTINDYVFWAVGCLKSVTIPDSVTSIGEYSFYACKGLNTITISDRVTLIGDSAFGGCSNLQSVTIGNSVTAIGASVFSNCSSLQSIIIPDSVTSIEDYTFQGCSSLQSITIPESVTSIGQEAFYGCKGLKTITIPNSVTSIGESVFAWCSTLQSITIPDSIISIGDSAFYGCRMLNTIIFDGIKVQWYAISKGDNWDYNTGSFAVSGTDGLIDD